jgi:hypothetical protein
MKKLIDVRNYHGISRCLSDGFDFSIWAGIMACGGIGPFHRNVSRLGREMIV